MNNYSRFSGKSVLVTGSTGGIGQALVDRFAAEGANLVLVDKESSLLQAQVKSVGERAICFTSDVSIEDRTDSALDAAIKRFGKIDIAVLNAGIEGKVSHLERMRIEDFDKVIAVNLRGVFIWLSRLMKIMKLQNSGVITITSSVGGLTGSPGLGAYVASKHAVVGLMKCAALEGAPYNIRVNTVNPGPIDTRMMRSIEEGLGSATDIRAKNIAGVPLKRYGQSHEIASMIAFLSSEEAGFSTGSTFVADGGVLAGPRR